MSKSETGTKEWAPNSVNIATGCPHDCIYCYAADMAARFKTRDRSDWSRCEVDAEKVRKLEGKHFNGRVMFPTTHDLTLDSSWWACNALAQLVRAANDVLVVSKSVLGAELIRTCWDAVWGVQTAGLFCPELRMSITTIDEEVAKLWEPGAPSPEQRLSQLVTAMAHGIPTSVSIEPNLTPHRTVELVDRVAPYCIADEQGRGGEIWIGKCNQLRRRTAAAAKNNPAVGQAVKNLESMQTDAWVMHLYELLKDHPQVRWKDSYTDVLTKNGIELKTKEKS